MKERRAGKKSWAELSARRRVLIVVTGVAEVGLAGAAWLDLARRPAAQVRGPKWRWALLIAVNVVGPITYFAVGRRGPSEIEDGAGSTETDSQPGAPEDTAELVQADGDAKASEVAGQAGDAEDSDRPGTAPG